MGAIVSGVAADLASGLLQYYVREDMLSQTTQDKPLMRGLTDSGEVFPGGLGQISVPVQGAFLSDTAGFFAGYSEDDQLAFAQAQNMLRASYNWKEHHAGLVITWSELKKDGITISDGNKQKEHSKTDLIRLAGVLKNRLADFGESWARSVDNLFWLDGSQDAKAMPGIQSIVYEDPTVGAVGGLDPATYTWWRNISSLGIVPSADQQNLIRTLTKQEIQIRRYGGKPNLRLCGSEFRNALEVELRAKGMYTMDGWQGRQDISVGDIVLNGVVYKYAPWLDDNGKSKYCYVFDTRRLKLRPMEGELNKVVTPERPYNYMVFLRSMTLTSGLQCTQRNAQAIFSVN